MDNTHTPLDLGHDDVGGQECKDGRSRTWMILLYPDDSTHQSVLERLSDLDWNFAGRVHDSDEGVKTHHHVVVLFKDGRKAADIAKDLGIDSRWLRAWDRKKNALRYLCHKDNPQKFQYSSDGIYGTIAEQAVSACSKGNELSEAQSIQDLCELLASIDSYVTYSAFLPLVAEKGLFSVFRRLGIIGVRLLDEHNNLYRSALEAELRHIRCENQAEKLRTSMEASAAMPFEERCELLERKGFPPLPLD